MSGSRACDEFLVWATTVGIDIQDVAESASQGDCLGFEELLERCLDSTPGAAALVVKMRSLPLDNWRHVRYLVDSYLVWRRPDDAVQSDALYWWAAAIAPEAPDMLAVAKGSLLTAIRLDLIRPERVSPSARVVEALGSFLASQLSGSWDLRRASLAVLDLALINGWLDRLLASSDLRSGIAEAMRELEDDAARLSGYLESSGDQ